MSESIARGISDSIANELCKSLKLKKMSEEQQANVSENIAREVTRNLRSASASTWKGSQTRSVERCESEESSEMSLRSIKSALKEILGFQRAVLKERRIPECIRV